ncbi:MAG: HAD-IC family P-type ATPase [Candidatus Nanopelagicales bacterium]|nr:HAD-IC family P-type ATPase [Candidatus Nanopelagicales bacterium]
MAPDRIDAPTPTEHVTSTHHLPVSEVLLLLGTNGTEGLATAEAAARLERFGPNTLPPIKGPGPLARWLSQFNHPLIYVLLVAAAVTAALGDTVDSAVILGVVLVNAIIGYVQESRADAALRALAELTSTQARVVRSATPAMLDAHGLVPGDLVHLEAGDRVPADARLVAIHDMTVDESMLTGESVPVGKQAVTVPYETSLADRTNMAYSGTLVIRGQGTGVVVATGAQTEIGRIQQLVGEAGGVQTPLTRKLAAFSRWLTAVILVLAAATFAVGVARGEDAGYMVTAAVALAVGAIPEGLPAAVTITLAIGVHRMARRNAIIRHLPAVEALGSTTVVCTDKTGTLTRNQMAVVALDVAGTSVPVSSDPDPLDPPEAARTGGPLDTEPVAACLAAAALCNNADLVEVDGAVATAGDPTETALLVAAHRAGQRLAELERAWPRLDEVPFEADRRYMATLHRAADGALDGHALLLVKGAAERLVPLCATELGPDGRPAALDPDAVLARVEELAGRALRVLAIARRVVARDAAPEASVLAGDLTLLGLACLIDPARPEAITSVARCREAGIDVKMITGDHPRTGAAIGTEVGLAGRDVEPVVATGRDLDATTDADLPDLIEAAHVFARVTAEQKLRIVLALQERGEVVAMTGDGVNDAPALKQADIGVAMGQGGSEVAKDAAAMILTDDNFATIEAAVEEGRGVFDNLTKFITWTLPTNLGEGLVITAAIAVGATLPITPLQILWINMTTAVALGLMLAFEPGEPDIMARPPRNPRQSILTRVLLGRILLVSAILLVGAFGLFQLALAAEESVEVARTVAVNAFVMVELTYLFNCRTLTGWAGSVGWFTNRILLLGVAIMVALQGLFTYAPVMHTLFGSAPLTVDHWLPILVLAVVSFVIVEIEKAIRSRTSQAAGPRVS